MITSSAGDQTISKRSFAHAFKITWLHPQKLVFVLLSGALIGSAALTYQSSVPSPVGIKAPVVGKAKPPLAKPMSIKPVVLRRSEPLKVVPIDLAPKGNSADKRGSS
jgi:hypothetical protein